MARVIRPRNVELAFDERQVVSLVANQDEPVVFLRGRRSERNRRPNGPNPGASISTRCCVCTAAQPLRYDVGASGTAGRDRNRTSRFCPYLRRNVPKGMRTTRPARFTVRVGRCSRTPRFRADREVLDSGAAGRLSVCER